jgi:2-polyprenyl-3-methyl-5-hydroxy-6-metoxy-1,4-benzoquinol methylase
VHVTGLRALDFGCRTGRSTRVLRKLGLDVTGVDISEDMLRIARTIDPSGNYLVRDDNLDQFAAGAFDLVLCAFPFDKYSRSNEGENFSRP